jgi:hypothetical protein
VTGDATPPPPPSADGPAARGSAAGSSAGGEPDVLVTARRLRELRDTTGHHGEQLVSIVAQLRELTEQVQRTGRRHADLAAAVSENLAPQVGGLHQVLTEELGQLRGDVDVLLTERTERDKTNNAPVDWASLTEDQAAAQWPILARWLGEVLVPRYELTRDELPDCWALHPPVVAELSWLRTTYVQAYLPRSPAQLAADWHLRWRPGVLTQVREWMKPDECSPGKHVPRRGTRVELPAHNGVLPRAQLAEPQCWWPFYYRAYQLDLAVRRTRAAAGKLDWSPAASA